MNPPDRARPCVTCGREFATPANNPGKRYCSPRCRVADWHHQHDRTATRRTWAADPAADGVPNAVPGGNDVANVAPSGGPRCPHCAKPVAVINLLLAPAAAHITTPEVPHG